MYTKKPLSIEVRQVLKLLSYTMLGLLVSSSAYFFIKMSNTAESGYAMRKSQIKQQSLESENRILKQRLLEEQSLGELQTSTVFKGMEQPADPTYILPKGPLSKRN